MSLQNTQSHTRKRIGVLTAGGPAPGINAVIHGITTEGLRRGVEVIGIPRGFSHLIAGDVEKFVIPLTAELTQQHRLCGGSILENSRTNPTSNDCAAMSTVEASIRRLNLDCLVCIGGDDTLFSSMNIAETGAVAQVLHIPKTIDGDLPLPAGIPTFGFQTAVSVAASLLGNLAEDARTMKERWILCQIMGRSVGALALQAATAAGSDLVLIPEEFQAANPSIDFICDIIEGSRIKAKAAGQEWGDVVIAEGLVDLLRGELKNHPLVRLTHDEHGNPRFTDVPLALILKRHLHDRANKQPRDYVDTTISYELRCAVPVAADVIYCTQLGYSAVCMADGEADCPNGAMVMMEADTRRFIPFCDIPVDDRGKPVLRSVDLQADIYACAFHGTTRLQPHDFFGESLLRLANAADVLPREFEGRYSHVAAELGIAPIYGTAS